MRLSAMGIEVPDGSFRGPSSVFLRLLDHVPGAVVERLLFGDLPGSALMQKALQRFLGGPRFVRVHFTAGPIEGWDFDCWTAERYFVLGAGYERAVTSALRSLVQREDVVYDVGAHAGFSALVFARLAAEGHVYAFEPSATAFQRLQGNVESNAAAVTPVNAGAWKHEGRLRLAENGTHSRVIDDDAEVDGPVSEIALLRLDDFAYRDGHRSATLVKIDVEGNAAPCLVGARELLRRSRPRVVLEIHDPVEERDCLAILHEHGYHTHRLDAPGRYPYHLVGQAAALPSPAPTVAGAGPSADGR
jgi:FkbM family methyltransferase